MPSLRKYLTEQELLDKALDVLRGEAWYLFQLDQDGKMRAEAFAKTLVMIAVKRIRMHE